MIVEDSNLTKIVHVVRDAGKRAESFCELLGLPTPRVFETQPARAGDPDNFTVYRGRNVTGRVKIANVTLGPVTVELIEPVDEDTPWAAHLNAYGEGVFSMVFTVTNFDDHIKRLEAHGMPLFHRGEYGSGRYAYFESKDQLGVTLCVQEMGPRAE